ncbi:recombination associated protein RdgC [Marinospirillum celere]|uniref:Recombination-associated protein RdgC n=1 Tax=Marinospirillum celere TaxID=1122252 RepID=A0A1I1DW20_9GAMM|nr:recombination-associated protein RdgC [Marinospirillum celere]SFB79081.1 recombination associated protein RdgC [Marinospirillum celere]
MWFKALRIYQARNDQAWTTEKLQVALASKPFRHCSSQEEMSAGWVSPSGTSTLVHSQGDQWLLKLKIEEKLLPASVVREQVQEKVEAIEMAESRKVGRKERQNLTDELRLELLPRAFTRSRSVWVWLDGRQQRILLDNTTDKVCELALNLLREGLGSLPVVPLATQLPPGQVMTRWLEEQPASGLALEDTCELRDPDDDKAVVRIKGQALTGEEITQHLAAGKRATQLRLNWQDQVTFNLTDTLILKSLKYAEELLEEAEDVNPDRDPLIALDAEFILLSNTLSSLVDQLISLHDGLSNQQTSDQE